MSTAIQSQHLEGVLSYLGFPKAFRIELIEKANTTPERRFMVGMYFDFELVRNGDDPTGNLREVIKTIFDELKLSQPILDEFEEKDIKISNQAAQILVLEKDIKELKKYKDYYELQKGLSK